MYNLIRSGVALLYANIKSHKPLRTLLGKILAILLLVGILSQFLLFLCYNTTFICGVINTRKGPFLTFNTFANLSYIVLYITI